QEGYIFFESIGPGVAQCPPTDTQRRPTGGQRALSSALAAGEAGLSPRVARPRSTRSVAQPLSANASADDGAVRRAPGAARTRCRVRSACLALWHARLLRAPAGAVPRPFAPTQLGPGCVTSVRSTSLANRAAPKV